MFPLSFSRDARGIYFLDAIDKLWEKPPVPCAVMNESHCVCVYITYARYWVFERFRSDRSERSIASARGHAYSCRVSLTHMRCTNAPRWGMSATASHWLGQPPPLAAADPEQVVLQCERPFVWSRTHEWKCPEPECASMLQRSGIQLSLKQHAQRVLC